MLSLRIALRYLFSKKSHAAVNIISFVSMAGVALAMAAIIIVLSVFNGFADIVKMKMSSVEPDFTIEASCGKVIANADSLKAIVASVDGIKAASAVIEEKAFAISGEHQTPLTIRGIESSSPLVDQLDALLIDGDCVIEATDDFNTAVSSVGIANALLHAPTTDCFVRLYEPRRRGRINPSAPMAAFRADSVYIAGVFRMNHPELDNDILFIPLDVARNLLDYDIQASRLEVYANDSTDLNHINSQLTSLLGDNFIVKNKLQQQQHSFRMIKIEKWVTLLMLIFILLIASFNILSTMSMLIVEKRSNMAVFRALGAPQQLVRSVFSRLCFLITAIGGSIGLIIGIGLSLLQQYCGLIKLYAQDQSMLTITYYPVRVNPTDILIAIAIIVAIGLATSAIIRLALRGNLELSDDLKR
jgi:ABC-type lipoprotein release transport system permease subunit